MPRAEPAATHAPLAEEKGTFVFLIKRARVRDLCGSFSRSDMVPFGPMEQDADLIATFHNEVIFNFEANGEKCGNYISSQSRIKSHIYSVFPSFLFFDDVVCKTRCSKYFSILKHNFERNNKTCSSLQLRNVKAKVLSHHIALQLGAPMTWQENGVCVLRRFRFRSVGASIVVYYKIEGAFYSNKSPRCWGCFY